MWFVRFEYTQIHTNEKIKHCVYGTIWFSKKPNLAEILLSIYYVRPVPGTREWARQLMLIMTSCTIAFTRYLEHTYTHTHSHTQQGKNTQRCDECGSEWECDLIKTLGWSPVKGIAALASVYACKMAACFVKSQSMTCFHKVNTD